MLSALLDCGLGMLREPDHRPADAAAGCRLVPARAVASVPRARSDARLRWRDGAPCDDAS
ncbi:hypothetical protein A6A27_12490 [Micromonospora sp. CB01531]|nr:hypothetical protein A6A27_12490 [Micromonospora sp. CB01531]